MVEHEEIIAVVADFHQFAVANPPHILPGVVCDDLPASLVHGLDALAAVEPVLPELPREPVYLSQFRKLLQEHEEIQHTWVGPAYSFPEELSPPPQVVRITDENSHLLGEEFGWLRTELAASEPEVVVRSQLASTAKRLPAQDGLPIVRHLLELDPGPNRWRE